jgi:hypothetical protein
MIPVHEKQLLDRVKDYASSVMVRETPWLGLLMNDIIVELTEADICTEIVRLRAALQTIAGTNKFPPLPQGEAAVIARVALGGSDVVAAVRRKVAE